MTENTPVHQLHPAAITEDALTSLIREGAKAVLAEAIAAEVDEHIERFRPVVDESGNSRVVRNGHLPEREILTGIGAMPIRQGRVRVNDAGPDEEELKFESKLIPRYLR